MYKSVNDNFETKLNKLKSRKGEEFKSFRFLKAVAEAVNIIIEKDIKKLSWKDYSRIATKVYKRNDIITISRIKNLMNTDIAKNMINNQLVSALNKANLSIERLPELYEKVEKYADEKKDGNLVLKLAEKVEKAHNIAAENRVSVSQTQIIDYSKVDQDGNPAIKQVKKIEKSVNVGENIDTSGSVGEGSGMTEGKTEKDPD